MMSSDFYFRDKIPVAVLGATSKLGQNLIQLLAYHPWFEIAVICELNHSIGQTYKMTVRGASLSLPESLANMQVQSCTMPLPCSLVFSVLHSEKAREMEIRLVEAGYYVIACDCLSQLDHAIPFIAGVNSDHLALLQTRFLNKGGLIANPQSAVIGLSLALKPLIESFELKAVQAVALQPYSETQAGQADRHCIFSNCAAEDRLIEQQCLSLLGQLQETIIQEASFKISVQSNCITEIEEDRICVSVKFKRKVKMEEIIQAWRHFGSEANRLPLPTAPYHSCYYLDQLHDSKHRSEDKEMAIYFALLRPCPVLDYKFILFFSHLMRGMLGSMLLNAEFLVTQGKIYW